MKKNIKYIVVNLLFIALLLIAFEQVLKNKFYREYLESKKDFRFICLREHPVDTIIDVDTDDTPLPVPFKRVDPLHSKLTIDKNGFIVTKNNTENPSLKLFFLGGSTTECLVNDEYKRFPELTARILENSLHIKINSYNCAVGGENSLQSINTLLNKVIPQNPDYAFFMHNINDLVLLAYFDSYWSENNVRSNINNMSYTMHNLYEVQNQRLYEFPFIRKYLKKNKMNEFEYFLNENPKMSNKLDSIQKINVFKKNLKIFISICRIHDIIPVLMTQPNNFDKLDYEYAIKNTRLKYINTNEDKRVLVEHFWNLIRAFNTAIMEVAKSEKCLYIDLDSQVQDLNLFIDEVHYNNAGSEKVANTIADFMFPILSEK